MRIRNRDLRATYLSISSAEIGQISLGRTPHRQVSWSGQKKDKLRSIVCLNLDPARLKSLHCCMTPSEMITCISLDLLWGLVGSFPNFQSICKTTWATEWWTSIRALFGNKGRIDAIHSFGKVTMYYIL